jgi:hypothetical protein
VDQPDADWPRKVLATNECPHRLCKSLHVMKISIIILIVLAATRLVFAETPWEVYLSLPTPENATRVTKIEYTPGTISNKYRYWAPDLNIMGNQILGGDREAFRLAYRLLQKADGGLLEELTIVLSRVIRVRPGVFLEEMSALRPNRATLKSILLMPGLEYVDRREAQCYEIKMRRHALAVVENKTLRQIRDTCLKIISER